MYNSDDECKLFSKRFGNQCECSVLGWRGGGGLLLVQSRLLVTMRGMKGFVCSLLMERSGRFSFDCEIDMNTFPLPG